MQILDSTWVEGWCPNPQTVQELVTFVIFFITLNFRKLSEKSYGLSFAHVPGLFFLLNSLIEPLFIFGS